MKLPRIEALDLRDPWTAMMADVEEMERSIDAEERAALDAEFPWQFPEFPRNVACLIEHGFWPVIKVTISADATAFLNALRQASYQVHMIYEGEQDLMRHWFNLANELPKEPLWLRVYRYFGLAGSVKAW